MSNKKELKQEQLNKISGGSDWNTDYFCLNCKKVTEPKTIVVTRNDYKETKYQHVVCSVCGGEYMWTSTF